MNEQNNFYPWIFFKLLSEEVQIAPLIISCFSDWVRGKGLRL